MRVHNKAKKANKNYHRRYCLTVGLTTVNWILLRKALPRIKSAAGEPSADVSKPKRRYFYCTSTCGLLNKRSKETRTSIRDGRRRWREGGREVVEVVEVVGGGQ